MSNFGNQTRNTLKEEKAKLLVELGQEMYLAYRRGEKVAESVADKGEKMKALDANIYELNKQQQAKQTANGEEECSCGAPVDADDIFCQECGKKVEQPVEEFVETVVCSQCKNEVVPAANFCHVCGGQM